MTFWRPLVALHVAGRVPAGSAWRCRPIVDVDVLVFAGYRDHLFRPRISDAAPDDASSGKSSATSSIYGIGRPVSEGISWLGVTDLCAERHVELDAFHVQREIRADARWLARRAGTTRSPRRSRAVAPHRRDRAHAHRGQRPRSRSTAARPRKRVGVSASTQLGDLLVADQRRPLRALTTRSAARSSRPRRSIAATVAPIGGSSSGRPSGPVHLARRLEHVVAAATAASGAASKRRRSSGGACQVWVPCRRLQLGDEAVGRPARFRSAAPGRVARRRVRPRNPQTGPSRAASSAVDGRHRRTLHGQLLDDAHVHDVEALAQIRAA